MSLAILLSLYSVKSTTSCTTKFTSQRDPLEQFEVTPVIRFLGWLFPNNLAVTWLAVLGVLAVSLYSYQQNEKTVIRLVVKSIYSLVVSIVRQNLYIRKQQYFTVRFYLFSTIFIANLLGLVPFTFTITSSFGVTFFLSLSHFIGVNIIGITRHQWYISHLFLPEGVPFVIRPFLILIERVSYIARVLSLSIRLFANRRSGHALLKILVGFALIRVSSTNILRNILAIFPWSVVTAVRFLELLIAFLQAYVFTILVTLYVNDTLVLH